MSCYRHILRTRRGEGTPLPAGIRARILRTVDHLIMSTYSERFRADRDKGGREGKNYAGVLMTYARILALRAMTEKDEEARTTLCALHFNAFKYARQIQQCTPCT